MISLALVKNDNTIHSVIAVDDIWENRILDFLLEHKLPYRGIVCRSTDYHGFNCFKHSEKALRKNFPRSNHVYDEATDSFIEKQPTDNASWVFDADGGYWKPPVDRPTQPPGEGMKWAWDEPSVSWIQVPRTTA